jgi:hypothetical protein
MKPLVKGQETSMIEIPANWYIDDLPPMMFMKKVSNSHSFVNARDIEDIWRVRQPHSIAGRTQLMLKRTILITFTASTTNSYSPSPSTPTFPEGHIRF